MGGLSTGSIRCKRPALVEVMVPGHLTVNLLDQVVSWLVLLYLLIQGSEAAGDPGMPERSSQ